MASKIEICNRALKKLGVSRISSLDEDNPRARACKDSFPLSVKAELRAHPWNCAIKRASLAESDDDTVHGDLNVFPLPSDYLRLLPPDPYVNTNDLDWQIEGRSIVTVDASPLPVRYVAYIEDTNQYDSLLVEAVAIRMAIDMCEELTNSTAKRKGLKEDYTDAIREARHTNAMENRPAKPPEDTFITVRY